MAVCSAVLWLLSFANVPVSQAPASVCLVSVSVTSVPVLLYRFVWKERERQREGGGRERCACWVIQSFLLAQRERERGGGGREGRRDVYLRLSPNSHYLRKTVEGNMGNLSSLNPENNSVFCYVYLFFFMYLGSI